MAEVEGDEGRALARGIRADLIIALSALLVSSLAMAATWWQTRVIQQQLSAQVWPYIATPGSLSTTNVQIKIENDGLGPAILRSEVVTVDGKPMGNFIDVLHALLGPHIAARSGPHTPISLSMSASLPGEVLRPGQADTLVSFTSKKFVPQLARAFGRIAIRTCYCAILPGTCWLKDSRSVRDPEPVSACREIPDDLMHVNLARTMNGAY